MDSGTDVESGQFAKCRTSENGSGSGCHGIICLEPAPTKGFRSSLVGDFQQQLAEVLAVEQHVEGFRKGGEAFDDVFARFEFAHGLVVDAGIEAECVDHEGAFVRPAGRYLPATASTALGLVLAIASKVRAAPLGCLRPCSQPCNVRTETPISVANCD